MFCKNCGKQLPDLASFCSGCGLAMAAAGAEAEGATLAKTGKVLGQKVGEEMKIRSAEAWKGIKLLAASPVGGLQASFESLEPARALGAAISFAVVYESLLLLGYYVGSAKFSDWFPMPPLADLSFKQLLQIAGVGLTPVLTLAVAASLARLMFRGKGTFVGDLYTASASLLPLGILVLAASLLGPANLEVILGLSVFALTYIILMLYAGCSRIAGIPEQGAAPAVPVMILLAAWFTKIVVSILFL